MRKITAQRTDEEWEQLIQECNSSGLSKSKWCRERGIPNSSLLSAIKRLEHKSLLSDEMSKGESTERKELIPLILIDDEKAPIIILTHQITVLVRNSPLRHSVFLLKEFISVFITMQAET